MCLFVGTIKDRFNILKSETVFSINQTIIVETAVETLQSHIIHFQQNQNGFPYNDARQAHYYLQMYSSAILCKR